MSKGTPTKAKRKGESGRDPGGFIALPWSVIDSPAYLALSAQARSLLIELARQYTRSNNGQLLASRTYLSPRGWRSMDTLDRAKRELMASGLIVQTVQGHRPSKASWYALTWQSLDRHPGYDPDAALRFAEVRSGRKLAPVALLKKSLVPAGGTESPATVPAGGTESLSPVPPAGTVGAENVPRSVPPAGHHLDSHLSGGRATGTGGAAAGVSASGVPATALAEQR